MRSTRIKVAILSICTLLMSAAIITGILAEIAKHFSDTDISVISMVLTLPFLVATVFAFLAGPFSNKFAKKTLIVISIICLLSGGLLAFFLGKSGVHFLLLASMLMGISQGMLSTLSMALIADYFEGSECGALMGLSSAFVNFGGMAITFTAAYLSGIAWNYAYLIVLVALIPLGLVILFIPKNKQIETLSEAEANSNRLNGYVYLNVLTVFFYGMFMFAFQANIALFMDTQQLGNATDAGIVNSVLVAAGGLTGIVYGRLTRIFNRAILPLGIVVTVIGFLQLFYFGNLISIYIAAICSGFGLTCVMPTALYNVSSSVSPSMTAIVIAMVNCAINVGMFSSPFILSWINGLFGLEGIHVRFLIGAIGLTSLIVIFVPVDFKLTKFIEAEVS